ncbi:MAG: META domain-containing protein [Anaerolineae bacterium]|nr:META domain-containing protein [Anaerolineae bacterium]
MKTHKLISLFALALVLGLAACSSAAPSADLKGTSWALVEISGQPAVAGSSPTLSFEEEQAGGNGSCNSFGGEYTLDNDKLTFGPLVSTMMYCEETMEQETAYLAALQSAAAYQMEDGRLLILDAEGVVVLAFEPQE